MGLSIFGEDFLTAGRTDTFALVFQVGFFIFEDDFSSTDTAIYESFDAPIFQVVFELLEGELLSVLAPLTNELRI